MLFRILIDTDCSDFMDLTFEKNPDERRDLLLRYTMEPLLITYDSNTIKTVASMFASSETSGFEQIKASARKKLESLKTTSSLALEHAIRTCDVLDVDVNIKGSLFLLPDNSCTERDKRTILCKMGNLRIKSQELRGAEKGTVGVSDMLKLGREQQEINLAMQEHCYDKFSIDLTDFKIVSVFPKEDWSKLLKNDKEDIYILTPTSKFLNSDK